MGKVVSLPKVAQGQPIPDAALEQHLGILGKTGSGKSNAAKVIAEQLMRRGERFVAIDPTGTWWGLRLAADGKTSSDLRPVIFGGVHADVAIEPEHGAVIAEAVGTSSDSAIIDTRSMSVAGRTKFFKDFAEALLRTNKGILHLAVDEAHLFAPKGRVNDPQAGAMLSATNNLVSLGRGIGLRIILISQRPAKLHNDALSCIETMVAMRLILPHDRDAIMDWIKDSADTGKGKEIVAELSSMRQGDAWVWSPQIDMLERVHFPLASTFDTGSVQDGNASVSLEPIDVDAIGDRLKKIRGDALANDPKTLKKRIAELEASKPVPADPAAIDVARQEGYQSGFEAGAAAERQRLGQQVLDFAATFAMSATAPLVAKPVRDAPLPVSSQPTAPKTANVGAALAPSSERVVNVVIAAYPRGLSLRTAAKRAGLSPRSSAFGRYLKEAAADPRIKDRGDGRYVALEGQAGIVAPISLDAFKARLPPSYAAILTVLEQMEGIIGLDEIAARSGISRTSSGLTSGLRELVELELAVRTPDGWALHEDFR